MARPNGRASHPDARRVELSGCRGEEIGQACGRVDRSEAGAGRFTGFVLPPLTFAEYLRFAQQEDALIRDGEASITSAPQYLTNDIDALNTGFINYLDYGGLPEAVTNPVFSASPARLLRQDIVDKVLLEDLPSLCGIGDTQELNRFFNVLAFNTGNEVSLEALSQHSAITKAKPNDHLEHVEAALLVRRVHRIDDDALRLQGARTLKVHLTNPSIRAALFGMVSAEDDAMGQLAETAVRNQWLHSTDVSRSLHYARWKAGRQDLEVDIVSLDAGNLPRGLLGAGRRRGHLWRPRDRAQPDAARRGDLAHRHAQAAAVGEHLPSVDADAGAGLLRPRRRRLEPARRSHPRAAVGRAARLLTRDDAGPSARRRAGRCMSYSTIRFVFTTSLKNWMRWAISCRYCAGVTGSGRIAPRASQACRVVGSVRMVRIAS